MGLQVGTTEQFHFLKRKRSLKMNGMWDPIPSWIGLGVGKRNIEESRKKIQFSSCINPRPTSI